MTIVQSIRASAAAVAILVSTAAVAQGVTSPDTEPSKRATGDRKSAPSSVVDGSATVGSRQMSNGARPGATPAQAGGSGGAVAGSR